MKMRCDDMLGDYFGHPRLRPYVVHYASSRLAMYLVMFWCWIKFTELYFDRDRF